MQQRRTFLSPIGGNWSALCPAQSWPCATASRIPVTHLRRWLAPGHDDGDDDDDENHEDDSGTAAAAAAAAADDDDDDDDVADLAYDGARPGDLIEFGAPLQVGGPRRGGVEQRPNH
jgi:hypothetical protein